MRHLKFTEGREVKDHDGKVVETYEADETYSFDSDASVAHWLNRQVAVEVDAPAKDPPAASAKAAAGPKPKP